MLGLSRKAPLSRVNLRVSPDITLASFTGHGPHVAAKMARPVTGLISPSDIVRTVLANPPTLSNLSSSSLREVLFAKPDRRSAVIRHKARKPIPISRLVRPSTSSKRKLRSASVDLYSKWLWMAAASRRDRAAGRDVLGQVYAELADSCLCGFHGRTPDLRINANTLRVVRSRLSKRSKGQAGSKFALTLNPCPASAIYLIAYIWNGFRSMKLWCVPTRVPARNASRRVPPAFFYK